ncbi:MAG TPA: glycoside hydrolase family 57 protein [Candidatus Saccharimonadales bacterium]|nr:glycoside hydrolase family 57 protein [Candidatus Saccharimonadales bacterium]
MSKSIILYLHAHQPWRLRHYTIFDAGSAHNYFDTDPSALYDNHKVLLKVAHKSYLPANARLKALLDKYPEFKLNLSITGVLIEQLERWAPDVLDGFKELVATGRVEIAAETYHHSLAFFYDRQEFEDQVRMHRHKIEEVFGQTPKVLRNTELAYNNELAQWAETAGYDGILAEGWDPILGWRSPNFMYRPANTHRIKLLLKNYRVSDDVAFRFGDHDWSEWPLTADKFSHWLNETYDAEIFNLFMDYETFGEHQWEDKGIFDFLDHLPAQWLTQPGNDFLTFSEAIAKHEPKDEIDVPYTVTWADTERDLTAWTGNNMQRQAIASLYQLKQQVMRSGDLQLIDDWRRLQTSDHFYYMCTKWFNDGDVHAYFSPYDSPYDAFINYMNAYQDMVWRVSRVAQTA